MRTLLNLLFPTGGQIESDTAVHGTIAAVWERHQNDAYCRDQSHWRGVGRWADDVRWQ
jgi:hypothetical protein